jgi:hypothetical protein
MQPTDSIHCINTIAFTTYPLIEIQPSLGAISSHAAMHVLHMPAPRRVGGSMGVSLHEILEPRRFTGLEVEWGP